jgi:hypothetical protein
VVGLQDKMFRQRLAERWSVSENAAESTAR